MFRQVSYCWSADSGYIRADGQQVGFSDATVIGGRQATVNVRLNISGESTAILVGITNQLPARSLQFQARLNF